MEETANRRLIYRQRGEIVTVETLWRVWRFQIRSIDALWLGASLCRIRLPLAPIVSILTRTLFPNAAAERNSEPQFQEQIETSGRLRPSSFFPQTYLAWLWPPRVSSFEPLR